MSKRFGRNQRRRMRLEIEHLEDQMAEKERNLHWARTQIAQRSAEIQKLRTEVSDWDNDVRRLLGEYSAFRFKTESVKSGQPIDRVQAKSMVSIPYVKDLSAVPNVATRDLIQLIKQIVHAERDICRMQLLVRLEHIEPSTGRNHLLLGYNIDDHQLMVMGTRDRIHLAGDIARLFEEKAEGTRRG